MLIDSSTSTHLNWVLDLSSGRLFVSEKLTELLGTTPLNIEHLYAQLEPGSATRLQIWLADLDQSPEPGELPLSFRHRHPSAYLAQLEPLYAEGELIAVQGRMLPILAIFQDQPITAPFQTADQTADQTAADAYLTGTLGIVMSNALGCIDDCNPAFCKLLGLSRESLLGTKLQKLIHPADLVQPLVQYAQLGDETIKAFHLEKRYRQANGSYIRFEVAIVVARTADGEVSHFIHLLHKLNDDITVPVKGQEHLSHIKDLQLKQISLESL